MTTETSPALLHSRSEPPRVVGLFTAMAAGEPMLSHESVELVAGVGILGDRYATRRGHWSDPRWRDQQLTLVDMELIEELGLAPDALRRNIVTRGVDLHDLIGLEFGIGEAVMRAQRICAPCGYIGRLNRRPTLFAELKGRGGIRVSVVRGGAIRVGDQIEVLGLGDPIAED
jgi:MOSC domain-containing protein YiiM